MVFLLEFTVLYFNMSGAQPSAEGCLGFRFLGAPEGSGRPAGERVHFAARLCSSRCRVPALPRRTAAQTGKHWWFPVRCFWSQYCPHAHWLLKLSQVWIRERNWLKWSSLSLCGPMWRHQVYAGCLFEEFIKGGCFKNLFVEVINGG